jgi:hypothetical protein
MRDDEWRGVPVLRTRGCREEQMILGMSYDRVAREHCCYEFSYLIRPISGSEITWSDETRIGRSVPLRVHGTCTPAFCSSSLRRTPGRVGAGGGPLDRPSSAERDSRAIEGARCALATRRRPVPATTPGSGSHRSASGSLTMVAFGHNSLPSTSPTRPQVFSGSTDRARSRLPFGGATCQ